MLGGKGCAGTGQSRQELTVIVAYPYVRGTRMTHLDPPAWLWALVAATLALVALTVVTLRRSR